MKEVASETRGSMSSETQPGIAVRVHSLGGRDPLANPWLSRELSERYLLFDACVGGLRRVDLHPLVLSPELHASAVATATSVYHAIGRAAERAHQDPAERALYDLHDDVCKLSAASRGSGDDASLVRLDLLLGQDGKWHVCEINADCPGGHNEATGLPELAQTAGFWEGLNPTRLLDELADRLARLALRPGAGPGRGAVALIYATAYAEDLQVCALIRRALRARGLTAVLAAPTALRLKSGAICVGNTPVSTLYRYYPTEYMEGQRNLDMLAAAVMGGSLRTLSSFSQIYLQSKLAFARAWTHERQNPTENAALRLHVPETLELGELGREKLIDEREGWVLKRAFGRVGDEVFVGELIDPDDWVKLQDTLAALSLQRGERWIAQRYVPQQPVPTPYGDMLVTLGAYLLDGRFVGYFARLTPQSHVSHDALCVPVFTRTEVR